MSSLFLSTLRRVWRKNNSLKLEKIPFMNNCGISLTRGKNETLGRQNYFEKEKNERHFKIFFKKSFESQDFASVLKLEISDENAKKIKKFLMFLSDPKKIDGPSSKFGAFICILDQLVNKTCLQQILKIWHSANVNENY